MKKFVPILLCVIGLLVHGLTMVAHAANQNTFELKVLPVQCVSETVADGSNEVVYLTPEACEQAPLPVNSRAHSDAQTPNTAQTPGPSDATPGTPTSSTAKVKPDMDERNIISQISRVAKAGTAVVVSGPLYVSLAVLALALFLTLHNLLPAKRAVKRMINVVKGLLP